MRDGKKASDAQMRATAKWEEINYDKFLIRAPKGTKERISATGESINGFVNRLIRAELDRIEGGNADE